MKKEEDTAWVFDQASVGSKTWFPLFRNEIVRDSGDPWQAGYVNEALSIGSFCTYANLSENGETSDGSMDGVRRLLAVRGTDRGRRDLVTFKPNLYHQNGWLIDPELLFAFNLSKMGDKWLASGSNNISVLRQRKNLAGEITAIEIRAAYLREFLLNRGLVIWISAKKQRTILLENLCVENISELSKGDCTDKSGEEFQSTYIEESHARWTTQLEQEPGYDTASLVTTKSEWKTCISPAEIFSRPEDARLASIFHRKY